MRPELHFRGWNDFDLVRNGKRITHHGFATNSAATAVFEGGPIDAHWGGTETPHGGRLRAQDARFRLACFPSASLTRSPRLIDLPGFQ
jgi:hypothetical protein